MWCPSQRDPRLFVLGLRDHHLGLHGHSSLGNRSGVGCTHIHRAVAANSSEVHVWLPRKRIQ